MSNIDINNIILLEGFNFVGKSTYIDKQLPDYYTLYNNAKFRSIISEITKVPSTWIAYSQIIDLIDVVINNRDNSNLMNFNLILDKGVFSEYVYSRIFNNKQLDNKILDLYKNNSFFKDYISHIYIKHHNVDTAQELYEKSPSIETFKTFEDYWKMYSYANLLFKEVYDYIGIKPIIYESLPNMEWEKINDF